MDADSGELSQLIGNQEVIDSKFYIITVDPMDSDKILWRSPELTLSTRCRCNDNVLVVNNGGGQMEKEF